MSHAVVTLRTGAGATGTEDCAAGERRGSHSG